jgi:CDP-paratose 2-epimerase
LGFDGTGHQVRDALHPADLALLVERQIRSGPAATGTWNVGGGVPNAMSLAQLSDWCSERFGPRAVRVEGNPRQWDVPWLAMDHTRATGRFDWVPSRRVTDILDEVATNHRLNPDWLSLTEPF